MQFLKKKEGVVCCLVEREVKEPDAVLGLADEVRDAVGHDVHHCRGKRESEGSTEALKRRLPIRVHGVSWSPWSRPWLQP